jgi:23S rRNA pseudouridine1911/1915/1917 synthase
MKITSRDVLEILRRFELADKDNVPRNIENLRIIYVDSPNTLAEFRFNRHQFFILFDEDADDDIEIITKQMHSHKNSIKGELIKNPRDEDLTYAMPFHQKSCYLFEVDSHKNRLDNKLVKRYPEYTRSTWQKYIKEGYVTVNQKIATAPKFEVTETDSIAINIPEKTNFSNDKLPIVFIDDNVIVVNKPKGVLTHSKGVLNDEFTVAEFFKHYSSYNNQTNRPGIVHRLDRDTSGLIIGARNTETAELLQKQFADRKTKKVYYAVVVGHPKLDKALIDLPISRNPQAPSTFRVDPNGKSALTKYEVIASSDKYSLVKLEPKTGRTHQLRVHMKYLNTPILGDRVYGKSADRLYLHAASLEITIPSSNRVTFSAPIPDEFINLFPGVDIK